MSHLIVYVLGLVVGSLIIGDSFRQRLSRIEASIEQEHKAKPTKYKDEYSFGYSIGLIKCSQIIHKSK